MDYNDIKAIREIREDDVNEYLKLGWVLLFVGQQADPVESRIIYSVGWPSSKGSVQEPDWILATR